MFNKYEWVRHRKSGMKYKKRHSPRYAPKPKPTNHHHIIMDLSFRVGRYLTPDEEQLLMRVLEEATAAAVVLPRKAWATPLFNDGEMLHVRIKINNSPAMLKAYMKRTYKLGQALHAALKEWNDANKR